MNIVEMDSYVKTGRGNRGLSDRRHVEFSAPKFCQITGVGRKDGACARFDRKKLDWINGEYVRALTNVDLAARLKAFVPELDDDTLRRAAEPLKTRLRTLSEARALLEYLWTDPPTPELTPVEAPTSSEPARIANPAAATSLGPAR